MWDTGLLWPLPILWWAGEASTSSGTSHMPPYPWLLFNCLCLGSNAWCTEGYGRNDRFPGTHKCPARMVTQKVNHCPWTFLQGTLLHAPASLWGWGWGWLVFWLFPLSLRSEWRCGVLPLMNSHRSDHPLGLSSPPLWHFNPLLPVVVSTAAVLQMCNGTSGIG